MKRNFTKHMIAAVSAAMLTMSLSAGVMAAEAPNPDTQSPAGIEQQVPAPQDNGEAPAQNMQQMPPKEAPQEGEKPAGEKPAQGGTTAVAPAAESTKTAQNATDKENMNLFQKFLQWLKGFGKKN